jgi:hypothetical protein
MSQKVAELRTQLVETNEQLSTEQIRVRNVASRLDRLYVEHPELAASVKALKCRKGLESARHDEIERRRKRISEDDRDLRKKEIEIEYRTGKIETLERRVAQGGNVDDSGNVEMSRTEFEENESSEETIIPVLEGEEVSALDSDDVDDVVREAERAIAMELAISHFEVEMD